MERVEIMERLIKKVNLAILGVAMCCVFTMGLSFGLQTNSSANNQSATTEEILLQKDALIKEVVEYQENVNPFFATSKATQLSNLSIDKLEELSNSGYVVYVVDTKTNENLPEPVRVNGNKIVVSVYSNDGALVDTVNSLLESN